MNRNVYMIMVDNIKHRINTTSTAKWDMGWCDDLDMETIVLLSFCFGC